MKSVALFVLLAVAGCVAQDQFLSYAGTTNNAPTFAYPTWSAGNCAPVANTPTQYVTFSNTYATSGVREVATVTVDTYASSIKIFIYAGSFDPANPCTNVVGTGLINNGANGFIDDFVYFTAGVNYTFVVALAPDADTEAYFAINVFLSNATGTINGGAGSTWWPTPYTSNGECQAYPAEAAPIGWYSWTQPTSGWFDILATFANLTFDATNDYEFSATLALYQGTPSLTGLAADPCNDTATGATYWVTTQSDYRGTSIAYVNLIAGVNYTAVFSGIDGYTAYWGLQVIPTRLRFFQNETLFTEPDGVGSDCTPDDSGYSWDSYLFTASQSSAFFVSTQDPPFPWSQYSDGGSDDTYTYLYSGNNAGTFGAGGSAPASCPLIGSLLDYEYTGDGEIVSTPTTAGSTYTAVIVPYYSGSVGYPAGYVLWTFTGAPIGNFGTTTGATTTTTSTTGTSTTGSTTSPTPAPTPAPTNAPTPTSAPTPTGAPTPAPTTSAPTPTVTAKAPTPAPNSTITSTSTTGSKPASTSTTSGASTVAVGVVVVVAAVAALL